MATLPVAPAADLVPKPAVRLRGMGVGAVVFALRQQLPREQVRCGPLCLLVAAGCWRIGRAVLLVGGQGALGLGQAFGALAGGVGGRAAHQRGVAGRSLLQSVCNGQRGGAAPGAGQHESAGPVQQLGARWFVAELALQRVQPVQCRVGPVVADLHPVVRTGLQRGQAAARARGGQRVGRQQGLQCASQAQTRQPARGACHCRTAACAGPACWVSSARPSRQADSSVAGWVRAARAVSERSWRRP